MSTYNFSTVYINGINAVAASSKSTPGIWISNNSGSSWTQTLGTGNWNAVILFNTANGIALSASNEGIWYSDNTGENWSQSTITTGTYKEASAQGKYVLVTDSNGNLYWSDNYGQSRWTQINSSQLLCANPCFTSSKNALINCYQNNSQNGMWLSTNNGQSFSQVTDMANYNLQIGSPIAVSPTNGQNVLALSYDSNSDPDVYTVIWSSTNAGQSWKQIYNVQVGMGLLNTIAFYDKTAIAFQSGSPNTLFYTTDSGSKWTLSTNDIALEKGFGVVSLYESYAVFISYGSGSNKIYYSSNAGKTIQAATSKNSLFSQAIFYDVQITPSFAIAVDGGGNTGIWYSTNYGETWEQSTFQPVSATSSAQGTATVTSSVSTSSKSVSSNLVTNTYTATATGSGTGETYDKALEAAAKASLESLVSVLYETARQQSPGPIVSSALVTKTNEPSA